MDEKARYWDEVFEGKPVPAGSEEPSSFCVAVADSTPHASRILELGCGQGHDAAYLARRGHSVVALDFSAVAVEQARVVCSGTTVTLERGDLSEEIAHPDRSFDVVYARLSLHYFVDEKTRRVVNEIRRVLRPGGTLHVLCKSTADPGFGRGEKIEADMYRLGGHVRHFFSVEYLGEVLANGFDSFITAFPGVAYGEDSAFVRAVARRKED